MLLAMAALAVITFSASEARAQVMFGPQLTLVEFEHLGIGVRGDYALGDMLDLEEGWFQHTKVSADLTYVFQDSDFTTFHFNVNGLVPFEIDADFVPYAGAGLNHVRQSVEGASGSFSGLNLLGGVTFGLAEIPAFAQIQYSTSGLGFLTVSFGVLFGG
ncbi:MAG: hypothetical protein EA350_09725 [Gemmatimonadales bacterium]|nr:MAG: hypothetical protein EA350_09725 [Gemmatimonadales bacterium]